VKYVGDRACADCHHDVATTYRHHPMGRALAPVVANAPPERYEKAAFNPFVAPDPFVAGGLHYGVAARDRRVFHREWAADADGKVLAETEAEAAYVVGSGKAARSYLINRDGYLFESPISWFPQASRWDLSPGYESHNLHFSRPVTPGCLFCHANAVEHVPGTANRYRPPTFRGLAIGCERCHGPGELHVRRHADGPGAAGPDDTIVNPARLGPELREAVCQQCHLQGEERVVRRGGSDFDYRPGLPLQAFLTDYVIHQEGHSDAKFVNSVEQMFASRCYRASREPKKLGCISCHDPHKLPAAGERVAFYRGRCLQCHTDASCSLAPADRRAKQPDDTCIACHMPRNDSEISHAAITDHRVPRVAGPATKARPTHRSLPPDGFTLVPFHAGRVDYDDPEATRSYGLALIGMLDLGPPEELTRKLGAEALPLLEAAVRRDRLDAPAWEGQGTALWCLGRKAEALAAYEKALALRPDQENTLYLAGKLALQSDRRPAGRALLERAVQINPWRWQYHHLLGADAYQGRDWERAEWALRKSLQLEPFNSTSRRKLLVGSLLRRGRADAARAEFETLLRMSPEERRQELGQWFAGQTR
jgi:Flp pilus assembly protein TadD